jgi:hypothetical protein
LDVPAFNSADEAIEEYDQQLQQKGNEASEYSDQQNVSVVESVDYQESCK